MPPPSILSKKTPLHMRNDFDDFPSNHTYGRVVKKKSSFSKKNIALIDDFWVLFSKIQALMILFYLHFFHHFDHFLSAEKVIFRFSICWFSSKFKLLLIINFEATLSQQIEKRKIYFFVINIPSALTLTLTPPPPSFPILTISFTKSEKTCYKSRVILIKKSIFFAIRQSASFNFETVHKTPF